MSVPVGFLVEDSSPIFDTLSEMSTATSAAALVEFLGGTADQILKARTRARFGSEGDSASGGWKPLAESTVIAREALGFGGAHPINQRTGELLKAMTEGSPLIAELAGEVFYRFPAEDPSGLLGEKLKMAQRGYRQTPARPVLAVDEADYQAIQEALFDTILPDVTTTAGGES
jgi:hypothetical protein